MKKLLMLAIAATAVAIPASASAAEFRHGASPASGQHDHITGGDLGVVLGSVPGHGLHCTTTHLTVEFHQSVGTIKGVTHLGCTTTSSVSQENNLPVDVAAVGIGVGGNWTVTPISTTQMEIDGYHINNKVTHPVTTHLVLAESTVTGRVLATVNAGAITHAVLSDTADPNGVHIQFGIPPSGANSAANISGTFTASGTIDVTN